MEIVFEKKIRKNGNSYIITIPRAIANLLDKSKKHTFVLKDKKKNKGGSS